MAAGESARDEKRGGERPERAVEDPGPDEAAARFGDAPPPGRADQRVGHESASGEEDGAQAASR